jgi:hypothetical protein
VKLIQSPWPRAIAVLAALVFSLPAHAAPVPADLRSAAGLIPQGVAGFPPSAPAGGAVVGSQAWVCDAVEGLAPLIATSASADPTLAVGGNGLHLPFLGNVAPVSCGQVAYDGSGFVYIAQGAFASGTASAATGILRQAIDPVTGQLVGGPVVIAANSGLGGNQPTAIALGPDGALYFGNLKNGDIKRILNPGAATQVVQSVGKTPSGRPMRAMAFIGNDLYLGSSDSLSMIFGATNPGCTGGCNALALNDGFAGTAHVGLATDGVGNLYFAVAGSANQVWRYTPQANTPPGITVSKTFAEVSVGGAAGSFSFADTKTALMNVDAAGTLWIGDDTSRGAALDAGRVWTLSAAILQTVGGGQTTPDAAILAVIASPWQALLNTTILRPTLNRDGTFTITVESTNGPIISTDAGTYTVTGAINPSFVANPQAHLKLVNTQGVTLIEGDILLFNVDQFQMNDATGSLTPFTVFNLIWTKLAP